jgi:hypothetical protein
MSLIHFHCMHIKYPIVIACFLFLGACTQEGISGEQSEYETFRMSIPDDIKPDSNKHIALILYNPQGCMPCNFILTNLFGNPAYTALFGNNSFVVFPSVRASELEDYDRLFKTYGKVDVRYINDRKLFDLLRLKDTAESGGKPKWLGLNIKSKECLSFSLREMYLADSIKLHFK